MNVLKEILEWSKERPMWQRDALRRLIQRNELTETDILELANLCKSNKGLVEALNAEPATDSELPEGPSNSPPASLISIFHHHGVNALAENQTLRFSPNLTVVYGDNGAGKTGYIRILKEACRARGKEPILGNVGSGQTPLSPSVSIKYQVAGESEPREWSGAKQDKSISRVSVFDTQSAAVYLTEKTDVAFRPFGLDLFDKLVKVCKAVKARLEAEQRTLNSSKLLSIQHLFTEPTSVSKALSNITSLTDPQTINRLANLTPQEAERIISLETSLKDFQANDPQKLIQQLRLKFSRYNALLEHSVRIGSLLGKDAVEKVFQIRSDGIKKAKEAKRLRDAAFPSEILTGTGTETWKSLWEAARIFSQQQVYPNSKFPVVDNGAKCPLCQQNIGGEAAARLTKFEQFVISTAEQELRRIRELFVKRRREFLELQILTDEVEATLSELRIDNEEQANTLRTAFEQNEARRKAIASALTENTDLSHDVVKFSSVDSILNEITREVGSRIKTMQDSSPVETKKRIVEELRELKAKQTLAIHKQIVLDDIERQKKFAAYSLCIEETATQTITRKSSQITKEVVSQKLKESFKKELNLLQFKHAEVELKEDGGSDGVLYHKLVLTRAPGVSLPKVASEGEQRCLSIAAFFAELCTADDLSGIVFDDPISSLDFRWRESVARRLVTEAKNRQVIVFTHDVVFLLLLKQSAAELQVSQVDQHVQKLPKGAGVCIEELPWFAMPVKRKIGYLKNEWQKADKLFRDGNQSAYDKDAMHLYGLLRSAWERALEEVLLGGLIERFRVNVQTQQIENIADISEEDCRILDNAMTKCSKWIAGHDQAAAARASIPEPAELKTDIEALEAWVQAIRKRRS